MTHASLSNRFQKTLLAIYLVSILLAVILTFLPMPVVHANTLTVTNTYDSGTGSLRYAISTALPGDSIVFNLTLPATITLSSEIEVTKTLSILGPGAPLLTISGNSTTRVITVTTGVTLNLFDITIANGYASGISGGGIYSSGALNIANSAFSGNSSAFTNDIGGGIRNNGGTVSISNTTFISNSAGYGAGIYNGGGGITITNSTFVANNACWGSGINNQGTLTISNSTFAANNACSGGGIGNGSTMTITNSTFSGNSANDFGGGINNGGTATIINSTFSGNSAINSGGGIQNWGTTTLQNTIVANSTSGGNCSGTIEDGGNNIDDSTTCGWGTSKGSKNSTNPLLGPLANNGGLTKTHALLPNSPAIDAVKYNAPNGCPPTDQRGYRRPFPIGGLCDSGAYEFGAENIRTLFLPLIKK